VRDNLLKVAYVAVAPFISGSERCLQVILNNCKYNDVEPILISPADSPMHEWAKQNHIKSYKIELKTFNSRRPWLWLAAQLKLIYILAIKRIQIVHSNQIWSYPAISIPTSLLGIKRVCHMRDPLHEGSIWWLNSTVDTTICISEHIKRQYDEQFSTHQSRSVKTIIDPVTFHPPMPLTELIDAKSAAKQKLELDSNKFIFGFIGQIAAVKGLIELLYCLSKLENKNWLLVVAGKDPSESQHYLKQCIEIGKQLNIIDKIKFIGFVENSKDFYLAVDLITMFSLQEPLGLIPLEAAVYYTPTIANKVGGLPETIQDGKTGWLVDINDDENTQNTINLILSVDLLDVGMQARKWVEITAEPHKYSKTLANLYHSILK
jgi:glycosyltransferase involved in cell wall biosynthesis